VLTQTLSLAPNNLQSIQHSRMKRTEKKKEKSKIQESTNKMLNGYWMGFQGKGNTLDQTPEYFNKATLFVAAPGPESTVRTSYLCSVYSKEQQIAWAQQLQSRGTEVVMCLLDTPSTHWNQIDIPTFVQNFKQEVIDGEWGLNGVDIDLESKMPLEVWAPTFTTLIQEFRKVLGPIGSTDSNGKPNARVSVVAYQTTKEQPILEAVGPELDWLDTMAYWNDLPANQKLFDFYSTYVSQVNLGIGVAYDNTHASTPLVAVQQTAQFAGATNGCGMMQYSLNSDCPNYTQQPQWTWASAINSNLNGDSTLNKKVHLEEVTDTTSNQQTHLKENKKGRKKKKKGHLEEDKETTSNQKTHLKQKDAKKKKAQLQVDNNVHNQKGCCTCF